MEKIGSLRYAGRAWDSGALGRPLGSKVRFRWKRTTGVLRGGSARLRDLTRACIAVWKGATS